jgi:hypothetical protein
VRKRRREREWGEGVRDRGRKGRRERRRENDREKEREIAKNSHKSFTQIHHLLISCPTKCQ